MPTSDGGILFNYEQCFECGTCYLVCNNEGAITWTYPEGGHGVVFHIVKHRADSNTGRAEEMT